MYCVLIREINIRPCLQKGALISDYIIIDCAAFTANNVVSVACDSNSVEL